jgi:hypothetical protein
LSSKSSKYATQLEIEILITDATVRPHQKRTHPNFPRYNLNLRFTKLLIYYIDNCYVSSENEIQLIEWTRLV